MKSLCAILLVVAFVNFLSFFIIAASLGGDAINGRVANGHFYLGNHGQLTEVSARLYGYSLWHERSLFVTHPLGLLAGLYLVLSLKRYLKTST